MPERAKLPGAEEKSVAERVRELAAMPSSLEQKDRMLAWARTLSSEQCRTAALAARRIKERVGRELLETVAVRWAEIDPVGAVEYALALRGARWEEADQRFIEDVMGTWLAHDAAQVEEWVASQPLGKRREVAEGMYVLTLAERDPARAFAFLAKSGLSAEAREALAGDVLKRWAARDPQAAAAAIGTFSWRKEAPLSGYAEVAEGWAERDPQAAMTWVRSLPDAETEPWLLMRVMRTWANQDPAAALGWLRSQPPEAQRDELITTVLRAIASADPELARAQLQLLPTGKERDLAVQAVATELMRTQPREAAALLEEAGPGRQRDLTAQMIGLAWARTEPHAAMDWLAAQVTLSREVNLEKAFASWLDSAPDDALGWARGLPPGQNRSVALGTMAAALAKTDVAGAQRLFAELEPFGQAIAGTSIAEVLSQQSIAGALQWATTLPEGQARNDAYGRVATQWAMKDVPGGAEWLNTLPPGPTRDRAIEGFTNVIMDAKPEYAVTWITSVQDDQHRAQLLETAYSNWLRNDPAKAREWAASTPALTDGQRQRLLRY